MNKIFSLRTARDWQNLETRWLAPYARSSIGANATRRYAENEHEYRTAFQRDRDRIIHSRAFRRLKHKRQVFLITEGDHFRTRMTHTLEVAQIARTMARALALNEDLVEAVALGHDLGHTPFGHLGEEVLNEILQGRDTLEGLLDGSSFGGFKHNYQSLRAVDALERRYTFPGLNLTAPVREGILKHTRLKRGQYHYPAFEVTALAFDVDVATTLEGQVVAIADEVAQRTHDLEDGLRAGLVKLEEVRELEIIRLVEARQSIAPPPLNSSSLPSFPSQDPDFPSRNTKGDRDYLYRNQLINGLINSLVSDVIRQTLHNVEKFVPTFLEKASMESRERLDFFDQELVRFSAELEPLQKSLNAFIYQRIIFVPTIRESDEQVREVLRTLFRLYYQEPGLIPAPTFRYELLTGKSGRNSELAERPRQIADFIAGMTDHFALAEIERLRRLGLPAPKTDDRLLRPARKLPAG